LKLWVRIYNHSFELKEGLLGGCAIDATGEPFPKETLELCKSSDAVLLGAVGGPKWDNLPGDKRPEAGLLGIRGALGLYANLRPAVIYQALKGASPLRSDIVKDGIDIMVVRELTGGMYFGERGRVQTENMGQAAFDTEKYSEFEVERIARLAFETAMKRNKNSHLWTKPMYWKAQDFGGKLLTGLLQTIRKLSLIICMWTMPPCSW